MPAVVEVSGATPASGQDWVDTGVGKCKGGRRRLGEGLGGIGEGKGGRRQE